MMLARIIQFLIGAAFGAGGGYLAWTHRDELSLLVPPGPDGLPLLLIAGIGALSLGVVFLVSSVAPRPKRTARLQAAAARRAETLRAADAYYSERSRAADRDWRSGALPEHTPTVVRPDPLFDLARPEATAEAAPDPLFDPEPRFAPEPKDALFEPEPAREAEPAGALFERVAPAPSPPLESAAMRHVAAKPVASSVPPTAMVFPSNASLSPIPKSSDPPPMIPPSGVAPAERSGMYAAAAASTPGGPNEQPADPAFADIRAALREGRLEEADRLLNASRETATGLALAELTGLAGDHAAAAGRDSNAKWLWRLALRRFGEAGAADSAAARRVSDRLRQAGQ